MVLLDLSGSAIEAIPNVIQNCSLKELYLRGCMKLDRLVFPQILSESKPLYLPHLEKLDITGCDNLQEVCLEAPQLQNWFAINNPHLVKVALTANLKTIIHIDGSPHVDPKEIVKPWFLDLNRSELSTEFCEALGTYIFHLVSQKPDTLGLSLGKVMGELLIDKNPLKLIRGYDLSRFAWRPSNFEKELRAFLAVLPQTPITHLSFQFHSIQEGDAKMLAATLPETPITHLHLEHNRIGDSGIQILAAALPDTQITHLYLRGNAVGDLGVKALASVLHKTKIVQLDLEQNKIGNEGAKI